MKTLIAFLGMSLPILIMFMMPNYSRAQTPSAETETLQTESLTVAPGQENVASKIGNDFGSFLANVDSNQVVTDLRNGQWTTTTTDPVSNTTTTTTESLPTGKMGWGNVKISLALAQKSLSQLGIAQPTSEQLHTALIGGEMVSGDPTTMTNGVLQMRSEGMGWGQIAQEYGVKLGHLMGPLNSGKQMPATAATTTTTGEGVVNASGQSAGSSGIAAGNGNGKGISGQKSNGNGIVNASGKGGGNSFTSVSHGSPGIVTGSGRSVGATSGIVTGGGRGHAYGVSGGGPSNGGGNGNGKGHGK